MSRRRAADFASPGRASVRRDAVIIATALVVGLATGEGYLSRMSHHAGYYLVAVDDEKFPPLPPPRHTFVVVVDGLRADEARTMATAKKLGEQGVCVDADVGMLSLSRPVYAAMSTGVDQDRTGSRQNFDTEPLAAESIWQVARKAGFVVTGASELPWFMQLFPDGFDRFDVAETDANIFQNVSPSALAAPSLSLLHPVYVDETAHSFGAASAEYRSAVHRVDEEILTLLAKLDLSQDLVVLTADHGHKDSGGHGGTQAEIAHVHTCFAGKGVMPRTGGGAFTLRSLAATLSVLLGVRYPRHMLASLEPFEIADEHVLGKLYMDARKKGAQHFVDGNQAALAAWGDDSWSSLASRLQRWQWLRGSVVLLAIGVFAAAQLRFAFVWLLGLWAVTVGAVTLERGSFDMSAINDRNAFVVAVALTAGGVLLLFAVVHRHLLRGRSLVADLRTTVITTTLMALAHVAAYGWPLGYPLPSPELLFAPFVIAISLGVYIAAFAIAKRLSRGPTRTG